MFTCGATGNVALAVETDGAGVITGFTGLLGSSTDVTIEMKLK
jgi:hypothetical protein